MLILDGLVAADAWAAQLKARIEALAVPPRFYIIQVGDDLASTRYIRAKQRRAEALGITVVHLHYDVNITQAALSQKITSVLPAATGLIIQLPLPKHINKQAVLNLVPFWQDIDGLAEANKVITPATARGIMALLAFYHFDVENKVVAVVGQSRLVGQPVAELCQQAKAHEVLSFNRTSGLAGTERADILIVAAGSAQLIKKNHIKAGVVIIDVGINTLAQAPVGAKLVGDVDRASVANLPAAISPVPGGVGPMTVMALLANLVDAAEHFSNQD